MTREQRQSTATVGNQRVPTGTERHEKLIQEISADVRSVTRRLLHHQAQVAQLARKRRQGIEALRALGLSQRQIGVAVGITGQRIYQIQNDRQR